MYSMDIGKRITKLRKERGMTQKELADYLNVTDKAVSRWEIGTGNPEIELIPKIAKLFNVTTDYLLGNSNEINIDVPKEQKSKKTKYIVGTTLLSIGITICIVVFAACLYKFLNILIQYSNDLADAAQKAPVGLTFNKSELDDKVLEYAALVGIEEPFDAAKLLACSNSLLSKYTLRNNTYWFNEAPILNNDVYLLLIPIITSFLGIIPCLIFLIKNIKHLKKNTAIKTI